MSAPELRRYQRDVIDRICAEITAGHRRILLVAPTGVGKTVIAAALINDAVTRLEKVVFVSHRIELTQQTVAKLFDVGVTDVGVVQSGFPARPSAPVQVCSVQTLHARAVRMRSIELPPADWLFVDECHHARARTYQSIISAYPNAIVIGLTATPCRADGRGLGNPFDLMVECPSVADLTRDGYLVPAKIYAPSRPDLSGVRVNRGDYVESQLAERVDTANLVGDIVEHWHRLAEGRRTVVFTVNVAHSVHIRDEFRRSGALAEHIDGSTPAGERKRILAGLATGTIDIVCNCAVLTEGWDRPEASCLVLARPTKSLGLYRQMVGRVLRPADGKTDAVILDHAGAVFQHGFPDDDIAWTLREDQPADNPAHDARTKKRTRPGLTACPECSAIRVEGQPCSSCGWHPAPKPKPFLVADGELGEVARDRSVNVSPLDRAVFLGELAWIARERGYQPGWVAHKFRERFGEWPRSRSPVLVPPGAATRAWVRSRMIAYTKSQRAGQ